MSEATAPWHVYDRGIGWEVHLGPAPGDCQEKGGWCSTINGEFRETFSEANAALIVKAVNAHDRLVAALETIQVQTQDPAIERLCAVALDEAQR